MCLTIDDLFPLYPSISPVSQTDRGIALCCMGCRTCLTIHDPLLLVLLLRFLVSWCILPVPFNFHFEPFGEWSIIYMFLSFSGIIYLFIFIIFKFLWLRWQEKKMGIVSYIRDCNVSFRRMRFLFISKFYSCCIVFYVSF